MSTFNALFESLDAAVAAIKSAVNLAGSTHKNPIIDTSPSDENVDSVLNKVYAGCRDLYPTWYNAGSSISRIPVRNALMYKTVDEVANKLLEAVAMFHGDSAAALVKEYNYADRVADWAEDNSPLPARLEEIKPNRDPATIAKNAEELIAYAGNLTSNNVAIDKSYRALVYDLAMVYKPINVDPRTLRYLVMIGSVEVFQNKLTSVKAPGDFFGERVTVVPESYYCAGGIVGSFEDFCSRLR